jgi:adenylate cyclase
VVWGLISILISRGFAREVRHRADALLRALDRVRQGDLNTPPRVSGADEFGDLAVGIREMMGGLREREQLQDLFGRHTSPEVVEILMSQKQLLDGARKDVTILFSDIRNFTQMSEKMEPEEVVALLNRYLDVMVGAIHDHQGRIDKFIGDGILAVFGFPVEDPDHVKNAVRATLAMRAGLAELNFALQREGKQALAMGAGLHTGAVVAGSIGSKDRLEYTVIGDTVNTASRIEGLTKKLDTDIVVSGKVQALTSDEFRYEHRGSEEVKGKTMALDVFALVGPKGAESEESAAPA